MAEEVPVEPEMTPEVDDAPIMMPGPPEGYPFGATPEQLKYFVTTAFQVACQVGEPEPGEAAAPKPEGPSSLARRILIDLGLMKKEGGESPPAVCLAEHLKSDLVKGCPNPDPLEAERTEHYGTNMQTPAKKPRGISKDEWELACDLSRIDVRAIRGGEEIQIRADDVRAGDVVSLNTGDRVPADGILLQVFDLGSDESGVTGEPRSRRKQVDSIVLARTQVAEGTGTMLVLVTGARVFAGPLVPMPEKKKGGGCVLM